MRETHLKSIGWILIGVCLLSPNQLRFNLEKINHLSAQTSGSGTNPQTIDLRQDQQFVIAENSRKGSSKEELRPVVAKQNWNLQAQFDALDPLRASRLSSRVSLTTLRNSPLLL